MLIHACRCTTSLTRPFPSFANRGQTFVVNFFLGRVPENVCDWETADKLGIVSIFGGSQFIRGKCSNCATQAGGEESRLVTGQISITSTLLDLIQSKKCNDGDALTTLDRDEVGQYLKKHLHWRVSTVSRTSSEHKSLLTTPLRRRSSATKNSISTASLR